MKNLVILKMTSFSSEGLCLEHFSGYGNFSSQKRNRNRWKRQDPSNTDLSNLILVEHYLNDLAHKLQPENMDEAFQLIECQKSITLGFFELSIRYEWVLVVFVLYSK